MNTARKNIVIHGAGWAHNMGNAFIQFGSKQSIERAIPQINVHVVDGNPWEPYTSVFERIFLKIGQLSRISLLRMPQEKHLRRAQKSRLTLLDMSHIDAVVVSGVWLTAKYLQAHKKNFLDLHKHGIPLVMNGVGGTHYSKQEFEEVRKLLEEIQPAGIITRDQKTYEAYHKNIDNVHSGIDVGFFVSEMFQSPLPMRIKTVYCFDRGPLPSELPLSADVVLTHHVHAALRFNPLNARQTFFSELPEDYLHLYANSETVISDRVHACVAALSFGKQAQLMDATPRASLFDSMQAESIRSALTKIPKGILQQKKDEHIAILQKVLQQARII